MKQIFLLLSVLIISINESYGWGAKGHDIVAAIAEQNLTPKAKKKLAKLLDNRSIIYYSSWMDGIKNIPKYKHTSTWHYANVDEGYTYETMPRAKNGDVCSATNLVIEKLRKGGLSIDEERDNIKFIVHLIADLHCPMHAGRLSDLGGNKFQLRWFNSGTNLHSLWDTKIIESARRWSYDEWAKHLDTRGKVSKREIVKGTPLEWFGETVAVARDIYNNTEKGKTYSYDYLSRYGDTLEQQLLNAGLRLATVLNSIYG